MAIGQPCAHHGQLPVVGACDRCGDFGCKTCIPTGRSCIRCAPLGDIEKPDFGKSINFLKDDPRWGSKVAMGAACFLGMVFIAPLFILMGYHARIARREREGVKGGLPEWDGVGELFIDGFKSYLALFLPLLVLYFLMFGGIFVVAFATMPPAGTRGGGQPPPLFMAATIFSVLVIYGFVFLHSFLTPAIQVEYIRTGSVLSGFHVGALWRIVASHPFDYFILFVIGFVLYMLSTLVGYLLCLIGIFATIPAAIYVQGHYLGRYCAWLDAVDGRR